MFKIINSTTPTTFNDVFPSNIGRSVCNLTSPVVKTDNYPGTVLLTPGQVLNKFLNKVKNEKSKIALKEN